MEKYLWKEVEELLDGIPKMKKKEAIEALSASIRFLMKKMSPFYEKAILEEKCQDSHEEL